MKFKRFSLLFLCFCCFLSVAATETPAEVPSVAVKCGSVGNFFKVSDELYRSAQPSGEEWTALAAMGIKSVINLRLFGGGHDAVGNSGIKTYYLRWNAGFISENDLVELLKLVKQAPKPVLIHCFHGSDRTGAAVAAYRVVFQNWTPADAADELVNGGFGHHRIYFNIPRLIRKADWKQIKLKLQN